MLEGVLKMPKPFSLLVTVEEIALGPVMARLQGIPGILSVDMVPRTSKSAANGHANGHDNGEDKKPHANAGKKRPVFEITGADFLIKTLMKGPINGPKLKDVFKKAGRSPDSASSLVYNATQNGLVNNPGGTGYRLTKKGRDKARYV